MDRPRAGKRIMAGGLVSSLFFAACCLGMLALLGITSFVLTLGAWQVELVSDAVLFPLLGASLAVTFAGYALHRRRRSL